MPRCAACSTDKYRRSFSSSQLQKKVARRCKKCVAASAQIKSAAPQSSAGTLPTERSVLVIDGMGPLGSGDFLTQGLMQALGSRLAPGAGPISNLEQIDISRRGVSGLADRLQRGCITAVVVLGLGSADCDEDFLTNTEWKETLVAWVEEGGLLMIHGERTIKDAFAWFGKDWKADGYRRMTHKYNTLNVTAAWYDEGDVCDAVNVKACMLSGVAPEEQLFAAGPDKTAVAVANVGLGHVGFFGDVNAEPPTLEMITVLCASTPLEFAPGGGTGDAAAESPELLSLQIGARVRIHGLKNAAQFNGRYGTIQSLDDSSGRFGVRLEMYLVAELPPACKALKPANLEPVSGPRSQRGGSLAALQDRLDAAPAESLIFIGSGVWGDKDGALHVRKGVSLLGDGPSRTILDCNLLVSGAVEGDTLSLSQFQVRGRAEIGGSFTNRVVLEHLEIACSSIREDALVLSAGRVIISECVVRGGADGVFFSDGECELHNCLVEQAASRGIFSNVDFIIKNSTVRNCGSYGIKARGGYTRRGNCTIQPGPWDDGGMSAMCGGGNPLDGYGYAVNPPSDEGGMCGFTASEVNELLCQGVKPWDDDAGAVMAALSGDYDDY